MFGCYQYIDVKVIEVLDVVVVIWREFIMKGVYDMGIYELVFL